MGNAALVVCQNAGVLGEPVPFCSCQSSRVTGAAVLLLVQVPRERDTRHASVREKEKREDTLHLCIWRNNQKCLRRNTSGEDPREGSVPA